MRLLLLIPGRTRSPFRDDLAHHSDLKPPAIPKRSRPAFRDISVSDGDASADAF